VADKAKAVSAVAETASRTRVIAPDEDRLRTPPPFLMDAKRPLMASRQGKSPQVRSE
jgi:hypothetical protein